MRYSTWWCVQAGPHDLASRVASFQGQSPLYYFVAWASTAMLGASEVALRVPSVVSSSVTAVLCGAAAYVLAGRRAGLWAGSLVWLTFAQVQSGVNARPYALAILGTGAMTLGYVATVRTGSAWSRVLFIGGSALQFWAHFLLVLPLLGLAAAHLLLPARRGCYTVRAFAVDCLCVLGVCAPAWPYVLAASTRMQHVTWLAAPKHADIVALLAPFALPLLISVGMRRTADDSSPALVASAAGVIVALEAALFLHANLVTARYLEPIVVPLAILAGAALSRLPVRDGALALVAFLAINGANTGRAFQATGTFSGLGVEDWRTASHFAREAVRSSGATLILLRSGFVEESVPVPGAAPPATRAVLAGPGEAPIQAGVISLTYRWSQPERAGYFASEVAPRVASAPAFVVVAQHALDVDGVYGERVAEWVHDRFGTTFEPPRMRTVRGVDVYVFSRSASGGTSAEAPALR